MRIFPVIAGLITPSLVMGGYLMIQTDVSVVPADNPVGIQSLMKDAKARAFELRRDSEQLNDLTRAMAGWDSYTTLVDNVKCHLDDTARLLDKLQNARGTGTPFEQATIDQIRPLLREMAARTNATIENLDENWSWIQSWPFAFLDYVSANVDLAVKTETLIRDLVDYGQAHEAFEPFSATIEYFGPDE